MLCVYIYTPVLHNLYCRYLIEMRGGPGPLITYLDKKLVLGQFLHWDYQQVFNAQLLIQLALPACKVLVVHHTSAVRDGLVLAIRQVDLELQPLARETMDGEVSDYDDKVNS